MFLAQEFDGPGGEPYLSAARPRIPQPELLSRLVGCLATAPAAAPGYRTDGAWVWPETMAEHARRHGAAPQRQLLEHLQRARFLLPDKLPGDVLAQATAAAAGAATPDPGGTEYTYLVGGSDQNTLMRVTHAQDGTGHESRFSRHGWDRGEFLAGEATSREPAYVAISAREAAERVDREWARYHAANVARERETVPLPDRMRVARTFDGQSPAGVPWFSPRRLRIPEPERRERIAAYLAGGTLVLRSSGRLVDPLGPGDDPQVPLSFRTDGVWVWQEALAYYARNRGLAPELELLCHIEEQGYRLPAQVAPDVAARAAAAARSGARPAPPREPITYYFSDEYDLLVRAHGNGAATADLLTMDLLWTASDLLHRYPRLGPHSPQLQEVTEAQAVQIVDRLLAECDEPAPPGWRTLAE